MNKVLISISILALLGATAAESFANPNKGGAGGRMSASYGSGAATRGYISKTGFVKSKTTEDHMGENSSSLDEEGSSGDRKPDADAGISASISDKNAIDTDVEYAPEAPKMTAAEKKAAITGVAPQSQWPSERMR